MARLAMLLQYGQDVSIVSRRRYHRQRVQQSQSNKTRHGLFPLDAAADTGALVRTDVASAQHGIQGGANV